MIRFITAFLAFFFASGLLFSQTARIQIIHNAPQPTIDVFVDSVLRSDNLVFRTATPYFSVPAEKPVVFSIGGDATNSVADAFLHFNTTFEANKTYTVFADGVVFGNPAFEMLPSAARETSSNAAKVDISVHHGAPGTPALDIAVFEGSTLFSNVAYRDFTAYTTVDTGIYYLLVRETGTNNDIFAPAYYADLRALGGKAIRVFASGYPNGDPGFRLMGALPDGTVITLPATTTPTVNARVQFIHNSPSTSVDIYANGTLLINDLDYRKATPYLDLYKGSYTLAVAPANSTSAAQAFASFPFESVAGNTYVVMASGIQNNAATPFTLVVNSQAKEVANFPFGVDISLLHGAINVNAIDIDAVFLADNVADNLQYKQFTPYISLGPEKYDLVVRQNDSTKILASYRLDMTQWSGQSVHIFAGGVLNGNPAFGLFAALPTGEVTALLPTPVTRVQIVHNAIDPTIDLYAGNTRLVNDLEYRTATAYLTLPADRSIKFGIAGAGSNSPFQVLFSFTHSFEAGKLHTFFTNGIVFDTIFPVNMKQDVAQAASPNPAKAAFSIFHGAPGTPSVDISVLGGGYAYTNLSYGQFTPFSTLDPVTYYFQLAPHGQATPLATFEVKLDTLAGTSFRLFVSGRASGSPEIGLFGVFPDGKVIEFPKSVALPLARVQFIHNSPSATVDIYWDNKLQINDFEFRKATPYMGVPAGRNVEIAVAPGNSTSAAQASVTFTLRFTENKNYILTASGIAGGSPAFNLLVKEEARITASDANVISLTALHGAPGAPGVDIDAVLVQNNLLTNLTYGNYAPYFELPVDLYDFAIRATGSTDPIGTFRADASALGGQSGCLFASGVVGGTPAFGLYLALSNGTVLPLTATPMARVQLLHNAPSTTIDVYANQLRLIDNFQFRKGTPFLNLPAARNIVVNIAPENSQSATQGLVTFQLNLDNGGRYLVAAIGQLGGSPGFDLVVNRNARETSSVPSRVGATVLHGVPNTSAIDVDALLVANSLVNGLGYGQFTPYLTLDAGIADFGVRPSGFPDVLGTFRANLTSQAGKAICIFASGLPAGTPTFGLFALLADGTVIEMSRTPTARVQIIHNAPSAVIDIYGGTVRLVDDLQFRRATPYLTIPASRTFTLAVAGEGSQSAGNAIAQFSANFTEGRSYSAIAAGLLSVTPNFNLYVSDQAREKALNPANFEVRAFNGSIFAPEMRILPHNTGALQFSNMPFGQYTSYQSVAPGANYVTVYADTKPIETVVVEGTAGKTGIIFTTSEQGLEANYRTWMALADGTTFPLPIFVETRDLSDKIASLQLSPNPAMDHLLVQLALKDPETLRYAVRNLTGRILLEGGWNRLGAGMTTQSIALGGWPAGMYLLEIRSDRGVMTKKFAVGRRD